MPKYTLDITDEVQVEVDVAPDAPPLTRVACDWEVAPSQVAETLEAFGGAKHFSAMGANHYVRVKVPLRRDGELVGFGLLDVWGIKPESVA